MSRSGGIRPTCPCGEPVRTKGRGEHGTQLWDRVCWKCKANSYHIHKKAYCEICGFVAINKVQLDVDHIDGNHRNNEVDNLQTLCANCHRLKTHINNDHIPNRVLEITTTTQMLMFDEYE